jgi:hypothetical protein
MAAFIFTCPDTSMMVQHWLDDDDNASENEYEAITCPACTRLHFINRNTRKVFGQNEGYGQSLKVSNSDQTTATPCAFFATGQRGLRT